QEARRAGATIVDLTYALEGEKDVLVRAPWVTEALGDKTQHIGLDLNTPAVVVSHPVAVMLALVAGKLKTRLPLRTFAATVMEPASEYGRAAMDELHQQTVNLLSELGEAAKIKLATTEQRIRRHYSGLGDGQLPSLALQMVQAPVFHGYVLSVLVEFGTAASVQEVEAALASEH